MHRTRFQSLLGHILNAPFIVWVLLGFSISYLLFFIIPIFFSAQVMQFFHYVPAIDPIGVDLRIMLSYSDSWFIAKQTPYIGKNLYPPLASVLFTPLLAIKFSLAYKIITFINIFCFVLITLVFPLQMDKKRQSSTLVMLVFITGLSSYGFQFELERGQFNLIAMFFCFLAIWIFHYWNRHRYLAYFLFTISVQLKVFPFIFIVMLIGDWQDWKNNIKRLFILSAVNFALFFVLGRSVFMDFIEAITTQVVNPSVWHGNHSIRSFVTWASKTASEHNWVNQYTGLVQLALLIIVVICIFIIMLQAYRQKQNGINPHLLLACTIGALLIPSVSHDYKLSILAAPVAVLYSFSNAGFSEKTNTYYQHIVFIALTLIFSTVYSSTLFSYANKPLMVKNNFPALITMLLIITYLSLVSKTNLEKEVFEPIETA